MGPYYITDLVNLLGPVKTVAGDERDPAQEAADPLRPQAGPDDAGAGRDPCRRHAALRLGRGHPGDLQFRCPQARAICPIELYGTEASMLVPDPNMFGGELRLARPRAEEWEDRAGNAALCRRELSLARCRRYGATASSRTGRTAARASWRCTCSRCWKRSKPRAKPVPPSRSQPGPSDPRRCPNRLRGGRIA